MATTKLPTRSDYDRAVEELKQLNDDLFYEDFKEKIKDLENNILQININNSRDFKKEGQNVINRANFIFIQMEKQQNEIKDFLNKNQNETVDQLKSFLDDARIQLLFVYKELQTSITTFKEEANKLKQEVDNSNKNLVHQALSSIGEFSQHVADAKEKLSDSDERNREFLKKSETFVQLTKEQLANTEHRLDKHVIMVKQLDNTIEQMLKTYEEKFQRQGERIKKNLVVHEEVLLNKLSNQFNEWTKKQVELEGEQKLEVQQWHEKIDSMLEQQTKQNKEMLESIASNMSSKEDLSNVEKKTALKIYILLSVVVIETLFIGMNIFI
jgi:hypothetical protein